MRKLLNTLFITTQGSYLSRERETVCVRLEDETKKRIPIHTLGSIACFGRVSCSPPLLGLCAERGVSVAFLSEYGRFWARVEGPVSGNVLLRREQYRRADNPKASAAIARAVVIAKIANGRAVLLRAARERAANAGSDNLSASAKTMSKTLDRLKAELPLNSARGYEGEAAKEYFSVFDHLILKQKKDYFFKKRSRRPPLDNMNALLSFIYTLLRHDLESALESNGLDPAVGFLHRDRPGRAGLALDLMEEMRPFIADRLALSLVNREQIKGSGFRTSETGAVEMNDETRKKLLIAYQKRKQEEIVHPFLGERTPIGLIPHCQALLFARYLRGDLDAYPAFLWK